MSTCAFNISKNQDQAISLSALLDAIISTYGAVDFNTCIQIIRRHFEVPQTDPVLLEDILEVIVNTRFVSKRDNYLHHRQISNPQALLMAINKEEAENPRFYAELSQPMLSAFRSNLSPDYSTHHLSLKQWLIDSVHFDAISAQIALNSALLQMNLDWTPDRIVQAMFLKKPPQTEENIKTLKKLLSLVYQHTPRWQYKGHTPHDLYTPSDTMKRPENMPM